MTTGSGNRFNDFCADFLGKENEIAVNEFAKIFWGVNFV